MTTTKKHFVTFESPGTMFAEQTTREIAAWDPELAAAMAKTVVERYGAKPFAFRFTTSLCADPIDDGQGGALTVQPKETKRSARYFINATLLTLDALRAKNDPTEAILRSNMACNGWPIVAETRNSYRSTQPFEEGDVVVDDNGRITERGDSPEHVAYRKAKADEKAAERAKLGIKP